MLEVSNMLVGNEQRQAFHSFTVHNLISKKKITSRMKQCGIYILEIQRGDLCQDSDLTTFFHRCSVKS